MSIPFLKTIESFPTEIQDLMIKLRKTIMELDPVFEEAFSGGEKVKMAYYFIGNNNKVVTLIMPSINHVKVFLHYFDRLELKLIKLQGKGKHARHFRLQSFENDIIEEYKVCLLTIKTIIQNL